MADEMEIVMSPSKISDNMESNEREDDHDTFEDIVLGSSALTRTKKRAARRAAKGQNVPREERELHFQERRLGRAQRIIKAKPPAPRASISCMSIRHARPYIAHLPTSSKVKLPRVSKSVKRKIMAVLGAVRKRVIEFHYEHQGETIDVQEAVLSIYNEFKNELPEENQDQLVDRILHFLDREIYLEEKKKFRSLLNAQSPANKEKLLNNKPFEAHIRQTMLGAGLDQTILVKATGNAPDENDTQFDLQMEAMDLGLEKLGIEDMEIKDNQRGNRKQKGEEKEALWEDVQETFKKQKKQKKPARPSVQTPISQEIPIEEAFSHMSVSGGPKAEMEEKI